MRTSIAAAALSIYAILSLCCSNEQKTAAKILQAYNLNPVNAESSITYPLNETLFPPEIVPPVFQWKDSVPACNQWLISVGFDGISVRRVNALVKKPQWQPGDTLWESIKRLSRAARATLLVIGINETAPQNILSAATALFGTSPDSVRDAIFYREVPLPFEDAVKDPSTIRWRFGSVARKKAPVVLENLMVCGNCHSFSAGGEYLAMDVDYANDKGSYIITGVDKHMTLALSDIITWSDYKRDEKDPTFGLLSQISPDGRYIVSTVKDRSVFVPRPDLWFSQLFFPVKGILVVYSREAKTFKALPGADDPAFVQSNPSWSPDQKYLVFARSTVHKLALKEEKRIKLTADECREFLVEGKKYRFDLYRIPFNSGKGGRPEPLAGAANNGMSNFFARYSPDGRWIVFCRAASYMLLQPDSRLYIMPAQGGEPRLMRCNTDRMNSWHSWSSNSRWMIFSSKKNSPYTQLFITHINERGEDTPPVLLDHCTSPDRAANIPEFVNVSPDAIQRIDEKFVDDVSYWRSGKAFEDAGDYAAAEKRYAVAITRNPRNRDAHISLGNVQELQGKLSEALANYSTAVAIDSDNAIARINLGNIFTRLDRLDEAVASYTKALRLEPGNASAHYNLGHLYEATEQYAKAMAHIRTAIRLEPEKARYHYLLGLTFDKMGNTREAIAAYTKAVALEPENVASLRIKALACETNGRINEAIDLYDKALQKEPLNPLWHYFLANLLSGKERYADAVTHYRKALAIHPAFRHAQDSLAALLKESLIKKVD